MPDGPELLDGLTLSECLAHFEAKGYTGQFGAAEGGMVRCFSCHVDTRPEDVVLEGICRVEGVSDPDDMLAVVAMTCPHCGEKGTATFNYGPEAGPDEAAVLVALHGRAT